MAAQTLDQVLASLNSVYQPQLDSVAKQQAALPDQYAAQQQGLDAQKTQAFGDILNGARSRGSGVAFGGIPLAEQAQYTASSYLPALANLKTSQNNASQLLVDAINKINENKFNAANNLYQFGVTSDQNQQQIDATNKAAAASRAFNPTLGSSLPAPTNQPNADPYSTKSLTGSRSLQDAYNAVQSLVQTKNQTLIAQTYRAIQDSALNHGNTYDLAKLNLLKQLGVKIDQPITISGNSASTNVFNSPAQPTIPFATGNGGSINVR